MLPLHSKQAHINGRHVHSGFPFGSRLPLLICLSLAVYLVYQRYYYQNLLQEVEDKLYLSAKQTSESQNNLMTAEQKIVSLKDVHEEDTLTISALTKKVKNAENEQQNLLAKLKRLGEQYELIDKRFQNLSVMMTETKASHFSKLEKNKADIKKANEQLMNANRTTNEYKTRLQSCNQEKSSLSKLLKQAIANTAIAQNNQVPINYNSNAANSNVLHPPMNRYSQVIDNNNYNDLSKITSSNISKTNLHDVVPGELEENPNRQDLGLSKAGKVPNSYQVNGLTDKDEKSNQVPQFSPGEKTLSEASLEGRKASLNGSMGSPEAPKKINVPSEEASSEKKSEESESGEPSDGEDPVKEHEDIVEKVNSYLKNNLIQNT